MVCYKGHLLERGHCCYMTPTNHSGAKVPRVLSFIADVCDVGLGYGLKSVRLKGLFALCE